MSTGPVKTLAAHAARRVRRRLRGPAPVRRAVVEPERPVAAPSVPLPQAPLPGDVEGSAPAADDAELDALRGALVRELDRLAANDDDCSASFRRA
jgi:hypothetical protein